MGPQDLVTDWTWRWVTVSRGAGDAQPMPGWQTSTVGAAICPRVSLGLCGHAGAHGLCFRSRQALVSVLPMCPATLGEPVTRPCVLGG